MWLSIRLRVPTRIMDQVKVLILSVHFVGDKQESLTVPGQYAVDRVVADRNQVRLPLIGLMLLWRLRE